MSLQTKILITLFVVGAVLLIALFFGAVLAVADLDDEGDEDGCYSVWEDRDR